ncbi:MAG: SMC-Scp complex subunit ScpB, partial [Roseobacter sp.]
GLESARDLPGVKELRAAGLLENRPPPGSFQIGAGDEDGEEESAEGQSELFED